MEDVVQIASVKVFHPQSADLTPPGQCMPSNVHHVHQCNSNNSNNTKVSEDSFSAAMPDTSNPIQSEESGVKMTSTPIKILPNTTSTLSNNERASVAQQEWKLEVLTEKNNNNFKRHAISRSADISVIQTKSSVFQKWAAMELDAHRPLAKRQLSAESSLRSCREVKKSTLRREETHGGSTVKTTSSLLQPKLREHSSTTKPSTQQNARVFKRKLRKELFSSSEVFSELDTRTIRTGEKLRSQGVFSIQMITKAITEGTLSELEKVRAIWIWLCQNIEYDVSGYLGLTDKFCEPERVVETGRGVCCGYSSVCLQMCREAGIPCKEVSGHGKGIGYRQGLSYQNSKSCHMWNVVLLEGHWYLLDACWGAGRVDMDNKVFIKKHDDFYFLTDPEDFINSHCPDEAEWQLLEVPIPLQEFEKRVLRTSGFYRMGLILQHPKYLLLPTENGEASVSIKFPKSVDFTYQISQWSASELVEVSSSSGLLTVTRDTMSLRLMPPASGTYDVMIFARPGNSSGTFTWVCSFLLECSEPKPSEELPENPFMSWGLQRTTESLGVSKCSHGAEPTVLETGTLQLHLQTSRPLMMLCELTHKSLDPSTSKRCLATQIEPDKLTCHVLCPYLGYYRLSVFVRDYERTQDGFQNVGNFVLYCVAGAVNLNELFPSSLSTSCGPGIRTQNAGLSKFSHTGALVSTQQGKCNITFQSQPDLELHGVLFKDQRRRSGHPLSRHIFFTHNGSKVTVSVALPESGVYKLSLYSKTSTNEDFSPLCDFVLRNSCESSLPPFPCTYAAWRKGSVLLEPRQGLLEPLSWVHFRVRVPGARRVSVLAEKLMELQLNRSRVWEGEVFTGANVSQVKLAASVGTTSKDMAIIMCFDVLGQQNEM